ncbi:unnamed protein product [Thlaspi arvense]|uniref:Uncharacterized protein n=1 Tax=Thlaspi arvense TaxID=13288 RepID=A0AAU9SHZ4_THLAR|nr:unnamed protein product [Thlaspi arvense]
MLARSLVQNYVPYEVRNYVSYELRCFVRRSFDDYLSSQMTITIEEFEGMVHNELFESAKAYLATKISPSNKRIKVSKHEKEKNYNVAVERDEEVMDAFNGIQFRWVLCCRHGYYSGTWTSITLDHPSTFKTLAMDPDVKRDVMEDLDKFMKRSDYYKRVGKAWKRGYLLYGPPGTGKSSMIAAMANHLHYDIYDLDLTAVQQETTRPGRMDMHIHLSYCTPSIFKALASNYLDIKEHRLFSEIEKGIEATKVTPADVAEQLMRNDNTDKILEGLIEFLESKKIKNEQNNAETEEHNKGEGLENKKKTNKGKDSEAKKKRRG